MNIAVGSINTSLTEVELKQLLKKIFDTLGKKKRVLIVPPDITRYHSRAGILTSFVLDYYRDSVAAVIVATGKHKPMNEEQLRQMFPSVPLELIYNHNCRTDVVTVGYIGESEILELSEGLIDCPCPVQINKIILNGGFDLIISIGQVVPHEVSGMSNHIKNILVGSGGSDFIDVSHFLGAVYGMERIMGRTNGAVRTLFNIAWRRFLSELPLLFILTVISADGEHVRGLYAGEGYECFEDAAALAQKVNINFLEKPADKILVYCNPYEYKSMWLANKSIYRTRMAVADGGEIIILAPAVSSYAENKEDDSLIEQFGYCGLSLVLEALKRNPFLSLHKSICAHLIHGSSEGRFKITYCSENMNREQFVKVGYSFEHFEKAAIHYNIVKLSAGFNITESGEKILYVANPGLGLWTTRDKFERSTL